MRSFRMKDVWEALDHLSSIMDEVHQTEAGSDEEGEVMGRIRDWALSMAIRADCLAIRGMTPQDGAHVRLASVAVAARASEIAFATLELGLEPRAQARFEVSRDLLQQVLEEGEL